jgi:hypothetical protein
MSEPALEANGLNLELAETVQFNCAQGSSSTQNHSNHTLLLGTSFLVSEVFSWLAHGGHILSTCHTPSPRLPTIRVRVL